MKLLRILTAAALAATLAGCVKNQAGFEGARRPQERPDIQAEGLATCQTKVKYNPIETKRQMAGHAHLKLDDKLPGTVCRRLLSGYLSGRMKWEDYKELVGGNRQRTTPTMARIIRRG